MKKLSISVLLIVISFYSKAYDCTSQYVTFGEISFYQDSVNPMTIHLVCKAWSGMYCPFYLDSALITWGDGTQTAIPLMDTFPERLSPNIVLHDSAEAPMKVYQGTHTYMSLPIDSIILIGFYIPNLHPYITNSFVGPTGIDITPIVALNFAYLRNHTNVTPPFFNSGYYTTDSIYQVLHYDPHIVCDSGYTLKVEMIPPVNDYPDHAWLLDTLGAYGSASGIATIDSSNGRLTWDSPQGGWFDMISYRVSMYKDGVFLCYMTRDFMIEILGKPRTNTSIIEISSMGILRCYPSHTSGNFTIDMTGYNSGEKQISIYDQIGQVVYQTTSASDKVQVDQKLSSGIYTVAVTQGIRQYAKVVIE